MKPMYALHIDANDKVLAAADFTYSYQVRDWLRARDFQPGDTVAFAECVVRADEPDAAPAFIETPTPAPTPATVGDDQPF